MNHIKNIGLWLIYFVPAILIELVCYLLAPVVAFFVTSKSRTDYVKRMGITVAMQREYIINPLYWFQTHDNAVDEWWYGKYNEDHWFKFAREWTQSDYDKSCIIRWYCRLMWLLRNCAYGFHYALFSRAKEYQSKVWIVGNEDSGYWHQFHFYKSSFHIEVHVPLNKRYFSVNIGWKSHKETNRLLYANRLVSFRKFKIIN